MKSILLLVFSAILLVLALFAIIFIKRAGKSPASGMLAMLAACVTADIVISVYYGATADADSFIMKAKDLPVLASEYIFLLGYAEYTAEKGIKGSYYIIRPVVAFACICAGALVIARYVSDLGLIYIESPDFMPVIAESPLVLVKIFYVIMGIVMLIAALQVFITDLRFKEPGGILLLLRDLMAAISGVSSALLIIYFPEDAFIAWAFVLTGFTLSCFILEYDIRVFRFRGQVSRKALKEIQQGYMILDCYRELVHIDEIAEGETGISGEECVGMSLKDLSDRLGMPVDFNKLSQSQCFRWTGNPGGRVVVYEVSCSPVNRGRAYLMLFNRIEGKNKKTC